MFLNSFISLAFVLSFHKLTICTRRENIKNVIWILDDVKYFETKCLFKGHCCWAERINMEERIMCYMNLEFGMAFYVFTSVLLYLHYVETTRWKVWLCKEIADFYNQNKIWNLHCRHFYYFSTFKNCFFNWHLQQSNKAISNLIKICLITSLKYLSAS